MKLTKSMMVTTVLMVALLSTAVLAGNQPGPVETNTETLQAEMAECTGEQIQQRSMVQRQLRQSRGDQGQMRSEQKQMQRFGRR